MSIRPSRSLKSFETRWRRRLQGMAPPLDARAFRDLFKGALGILSGGVVMVHAGLSLALTNLSREKVLEIPRECVGPWVTVVTPTFPRMSSAAYLGTVAPFDARTTRAGMGTLSEDLPRLPDSYR